MDIERLTVIGPIITQKGLRLKELQDERAALTKEIDELTAELKPLILEQAQITNQLVGGMNHILGTASGRALRPAPEPEIDVVLDEDGNIDPLEESKPVAGPQFGAAPSKKVTDRHQLKRKIIAFCEKRRAETEEGVSAYEVGKALGIPGHVVRQLMAEIHMGS